MNTSLALGVEQVTLAKTIIVALGVDLVALLEDIRVLDLPVPLTRQPLTFPPRTSYLEATPLIEEAITAL